MSEEAEDVHPVVFPSPSTRAAGTGGLNDAAQSPLIAPPPRLPEAARDGDSSLTDRVEQTLAGDGRFAALRPGLTVAVEAGRVRLAGAGGSADLRRMLRETVAAVPGVQEVHFEEDGLG